MGKMIDRDKTVQRALFDEAVRLGNQSVTQSNKYLTISRGLIDAIEDSLAMLRTGRVTDARVRLERAITATTKMLA